ncbi:hypothetical protein Tco_1014048, partial [Tanacetum coccineum]
MLSANNSEPNHFWGSNATNVPSSSSCVNERLSRLFSGIWTLDAQNIYVRENRFLSAHFFVSKFLGTVRFGNDQIAKIIGYGDYQLGNNLKGVDLLSRSRRPPNLLHHFLLIDMLMTSLDLSTFKASKDRAVMASSVISSQLRSKTRASRMTPATSSSGLVPNPVPQQPFNPSIRNDLDRLFQPMFDEYFNPPSSVVSPVLIATAPRAIDIAGSPSSKTIDQYAPSSSTSSTNQQQQSSIISQRVEEPIPNALFDDPCHEPLHDVFTSQESSSNVQSSHSLLELIGKWTKDHPLANIIGDPSRRVSTRKQLETDAMWCYFDAFLTSVE